MEIFEIPITIYKTQKIRVNANSLEEAKHNIKKHMHSQKQLFVFDEISEAIIIERKEIEHVISQMSVMWDRINKRRD
jgi:ribosomal protein L16/L10AE